MPRGHNSLSHYNNCWKLLTQTVFEQQSSFYFRQICWISFHRCYFFSCFISCRKAKRKVNWLAIFKNVRNVSNNRVNLYFFSTPARNFLLVVIHCEITRETGKEWSNERNEKTQNQNGKLMATRNNNKKTFLSINRSSEKEAILIVRKRNGSSDEKNCCTFLDF